MIVSMDRSIRIALSSMACSIILYSVLVGCSGGGATDPFSARNRRKAAQQNRQNSSLAKKPANLAGSLVAKPLKSGTNEDLLAVAWIRGRGGLAVGRSGTVIRFSASGQSDLLEVPVIEDLYGVCLARDNEGWVVGASGTVFQYDGIKLTQIETGLDVDLFDCETMSNGWARAVGDGGVLLSLSSKAVKSLEYSTKFQGIIRSVEVAAFGHVYLAGSAGSIYYGDDNDEYAKQKTVVSHDLYDMVFQDVTRGWAVGSFGTILRYADRGWEEIRSNLKIKEDFKGISYSNGRIVACGGRGNVVEILKSGSRKIMTPARESLNGIAATRKGFIMVGDQGKAWTLAPEVKIQHLVLSGKPSRIMQGGKVKFEFELDPGNKVKWSRIEISGSLDKDWYSKKLKVYWKKKPVPTLENPKSASGTPTALSAGPTVQPEPVHPGSVVSLNDLQDSNLASVGSKETGLAKGASNQNLMWKELGPLKGSGQLTGSYEVHFPLVEGQGLAVSAESLKIRVLLDGKDKKGLAKNKKSSWKTYESNVVKITVLPAVRP